MEIQCCTIQDIPLLARMNKRLIEDEGSDNPMTVPELEERMLGFLGSEYHGYFFTEGETVLGYALVRHTASPLYLRQFYVERAYRRRHIGQRAFHLLLTYLETDRIDIDVLPWNEAGQQFWKSCGFAETCVSMRYQKK